LIMHQNSTQWHDFYNLPQNPTKLSNKPPKNLIMNNHNISLKSRFQTKLDSQGFEFSNSSLSKEAMKKCHDLVNPDTPPKTGYFQTERDISSFMFAPRYKRIRYLCVHGKSFTCLPRSLNYFIQHQQYNSISGGFKRSYQVIPSYIVLKYLRPAVEDFIAKFGLKDGELIITQIQCSKYQPSGDKNATGQGIHQDGARNAALHVLHRDENLIGGQSEIYEASDSKFKLLAAKTLQAGDMYYWKDDEVWHNVTDAAACKEAMRTVLLLHGDAERDLVGIKNPHIKENKSEVKKARNDESKQYSNELLMRELANTEHLNQMIEPDDESGDFN